MLQLIIMMPLQLKMMVHVHILLLWLIYISLRLQKGVPNNKYFEVYNPTVDTVLLSDYAYQSVSNAPSTPGVYEYWNDFDSGAYIAPGDVYVVAHPYSADATISAVADQTHPYLSNGDDGLCISVWCKSRLTNVDPASGGYVILDLIGDWNGDPGSGWECSRCQSNATQNHTSA